MYTLNALDDQINKYDVSDIRPNLLIPLITNALQRASVTRLSKGLEIISDRFKYAIENPVQIGTDEPAAKRRKTDRPQQSITITITTITTATIKTGTTDSENRT